MDTVIRITSALLAPISARVKESGAFVRFHLIAGYLIAEVTIGGAVLANDEERIAELRSRWKERSEVIHTLSVQAVATTSLSKNAVELRRRMASELTFANDPLARFTVLEDGSALCRNPLRIVVAGARSRVEHGDERRTDTDRYITAVDGQSLKSMNPMGGESEGTRYPTGYVYDASSERARPEPDLWPLLWYSVGPEQCCARVNNRTSEVRYAGEVDVDGESCWRIAVDGPRPTQTTEFLLSCTKAYHVLRMTRTNKGHTLMQIDCAYAPDATHQWALASWTLTMLGGHDVADTITQVAIDHFEVNPTIDEAAFTIKFPPGTVVSDYREKARKGRTGSYDYVVRPDESERVVFQAS